ncbi:ATP-binding cassette domain-containing protein, partial [Lacticaseibacillus casei]|nr:ATP-binding cassette domain-containing protein [Lacticaseibacillus casei]
TKTSILNDINLDIPWGIYLTIAGHSVSGKITFLLLLATFLTPTSGTLLYNGNPQSAYDPILYLLVFSYFAPPPSLFGASVAHDLPFPFVLPPSPS